MTASGVLPVCVSSSLYGKTKLACDFVQGSFHTFSVQRCGVGQM